MKNHKILIVVDKETRSEVQLSKYELKNTKSINTIDPKLKKVVKQINKANLIITQGNWFEDQLCRNAIEIARILNKTVIHHTTFNHYVSANNN
jgi:hypothetical protein